MVLKTYMACDGDSEQGAVLVFAHTAREAKKVGWPAITGWACDAEYTDLRVLLIRDKPHLFEDADKVMLVADKAHANDNPTSCPNCGMWGAKINKDGICEDCLE